MRGEHAKVRAMLLNEGLEQTVDWRKQNYGAISQYGVLDGRIGLYSMTSCENIGCNKPLNLPPISTESDLTKKSIHRNQLPPPLQFVHEVREHPYAALFWDAMDKEYSALDERGTWTIVDRPNDTYAVPTMWVSSYKFDDNEYLKQAKARLCVQSNKQVMTFEETCAATLAARSFRTLMALVATFGLNILQYDALNAFLNSCLDKLVYVEMAPGRKQPGKVFRLIRALYGLR